MLKSKIFSFFKILKFIYKKIFILHDRVHTHPTSDLNNFFTPSPSELDKLCHPLLVYVSYDTGKIFLDQHFFDLKIYINVCSAVSSNFLRF